MPSIASFPARGRDILWDPLPRASFGLGWPETGCETGWGSSHGPSLGGWRCSREASPETGSGHGWGRCINWAGAGCIIGAGGGVLLGLEGVYYLDLGWMYYFILPPPAAGGICIIGRGQVKTAAGGWGDLYLLAGRTCIINNTSSPNYHSNLINSPHPRRSGPQLVGQAAAAGAASCLGAP